ncbi:transcriptional activator FtrA [Streptomyces rubrolavendulae]|uniref:Transcriptional activator FtrA n=1 Tax=Streptomyces rubrolavendulae TaxID=285473 RepID=A0A1D8G9S9_9ACTN|nr:transcriptional activator FtrA [Streptomyces rubrolavendulae]
MSVSAFHRNFHAVTAMSPIQFQKQIRLQAARLMMANRPHDVTGVGHRVGYDSPSQFSREYKRQFGVPPSVDAARLRRRVDHAAAACQGLSGPRSGVLRPGGRRSDAPAPAAPAPRPRREALRARGRLQQVLPGSTGVRSTRYASTAVSTQAPARPYAVWPSPS